MEPEEYNDGTNDPRFQNPIDFMVWSINDEERNYVEYLLNNADHELQQIIERRALNEHYAAQNGSSGEMRPLFDRSFIHNLIMISYFRNSVRRHNYWRRELPEENSEQIVPGNKVRACPTSWFSGDQIVPDGAIKTSTATSSTRTQNNPVMNSRLIIQEQMNRNGNTPYSVHPNRALNRNIYSNAFSEFRLNATRDRFGGTGMRQGGHNRNEISREEISAVEPIQMNPETSGNVQSENNLGFESNIDKTGVNLITRRTRVPKRKQICENCQNIQERNRTFIYEKARRLESCHKRIKIENSSSGREDPTSAIQDTQCQGATSSSSTERNVLKTGERDIRFLSNYEAKIPFPSPSTQNCNKKRSQSFEEQKISNPNPSIPNTGMSSFHTNSITGNNCPHIYSCQPRFRKFSDLSYQNMSIDQSNFIPQVPQFSNAPVNSCSNTISLHENGQNDNSSVCLKNTDRKNLIAEENTTSYPLQYFRYSPHMDMRNQYSGPNIHSKNEYLSFDKSESNMMKHRSISANKRVNSNTEKEYILAGIHKSRHLQHSCIPASRIANFNIASPYFSHELHNHHEYSPPNLSTYMTSLHHKPLKPGKQSKPLHFNTYPYLFSCIPKTKLMSSFHTKKDKIKRLKELNDHWKEKKNKLMHGKILKLSPPANVFVKRKSSSLNIEDRGMGRSEATLGKIKINPQCILRHSYRRFNVPSVQVSIQSPKMKENSFSLNSVINPEQCSSEVSQERSMLQSRQVRSNENSWKEDRKFGHEIIQGKIPISLKLNVLDLPANDTSNEQRKNDNPISKTHCPIPGTKAIGMAMNTCSLHGDTPSIAIQPFNNIEYNSNELEYLNSEQNLKLQMNSKTSGYTSKISQQNSRENTLNNLSPSCMKSDEQNTDSAMGESCSRSNNSDEYDDTSESSNPNI